jgi:predicted CopG family antitoxin
MGNSCCFNHVVNPNDKNICIDIDSYNRIKNELNTKKSYSNSLNYFEKYKIEDNCSILINAFNKETKYIVSYKESEERKKFKQKNK